MTIRATIHSNVNGSVTVQMDGDLDYESSQPLRENLQDIQGQYPHSTIYLDMSKVDFVGSSGIGLFVETVRIMNKEKNGVRLKNVNSEFKKVFRLYTLDAEVLADFENDDTDLFNVLQGKRNRTFEN